MLLESLRSKIVIVFLILILGGCSSLTDIHCSFWLPRIGLGGIINNDIDAAIRESSAGTKCEAKF